MNKKVSASQDEHFMSMACRLALRGMGKTRPNPMVGAVLVRDGEVIGTGYHKKCGGPHAEVVAIQNATRNPSGSTLYVNLEPCSHYGNTPPCVDLILDKKIATVVMGTVDPNPRVNGRSIRRLAENGVNVICGVLEKECLNLNEVFFRFMRSRRPFVTLKAAMSLDGKVACSTGVSQWISCPASREKVHRLRSRVDAVLVGVGTVLSDDPLLTVRGIPGALNPLRVVVDSRLRIPEHAKVLGPEAPTLIATTCKAPQDKIESLRQRGILVEQFSVEEQGRVSLPSLLKGLGKRRVQHLVIEGGSRLFTSVVEQRSVDKFLFFIAPVLLGGASAPSLFGGKGFPSPDAGASLEIVRIRRSDRDILVEGRPVPPGRPGRE
jgi:diaminohydroxyphosphoribosylaminopyrimidine deaminase / 5-amino-6-(5-phosphoribosylamino)uracil reductase